MCVCVCEEVVESYVLDKLWVVTSAKAGGCGWVCIGKRMVVYACASVCVCVHVCVCVCV